ncbi:metalloendopeptidase [Extremus antarcticus]|uniref:Metalloendopeptidase n=1 Tax=Extremus antarcticus TaxID=702011 RepID=A0AAJ0GFN7_9PEZI|nr:metalloendopeptidase [Extremus antarcticus]
MLLPRLLRPFQLRQHRSPFARQHGFVRLPLPHPGVHGRAAQFRGYRAVNHRQLLASWNALRLWFKDPLFYFHIAGIGGLWGLYYVYNLDRVPITHRWRFNTVSQHHEKQLAQRLVRDVLDNGDSTILPDSSSEHTTVQRVFDRLVPAAGLVDTDWEVHVIDDPNTMNAFVLPGGKVFIYTGMLHLCSSDDELATILSHEIAHNICRHGSESVSRTLLWVPGFVISSLASGLDPDLVEVGMDVAFRYPNSRVHEREADYVGLLLMAESGYDPSAALNWWKTMEEVKAREVKKSFGLTTTFNEVGAALGMLSSMQAEARTYREASCSTLDRDRVREKDNQISKLWTFTMLGA